MKLPVLILTIATWITYQPFIMALLNYSRVQRQNAGSFCGTPAAIACGYVMMAAIVFIPFLLATGITGFVMRRKLSRRSKIWIVATCLCGVALLATWPMVGGFR